MPFNLKKEGKEAPIYELDKQSRDNLRGVDPLILRIIERAKTISRVDFGIPSNGGLMTPVEQKLLYDIGKSEADGFNIKSRQQEGTAFNVVAYSKGELTWERDKMTHIAVAIMQAATIEGVALEWGGFSDEWGSLNADTPQFQMVRRNELPNRAKALT